MACVPRQAGAAWTRDAGRLGRVLVHHGVGEVPDARVPRGSERGREGGEAGRAAIWAGKVELGRLGREKKWGRGKEWACWAENVFFFFLKTKQTDSIQIQTQRFEFKLNFKH